VSVITDRLDDIIKNADDLSPLAEPIRQRLWEGNRAAILAGESPDGSTVAPLKPATMKHRGGAGPPRAPHGSSSRVVRDYVVMASVCVGRITFTGSWPNFGPIVEAFDQGTGRMPARPTMGFRQVDLQWCRDQLRDHVMKRGR
jgi:hypothetical protein